MAHLRSLQLRSSVCLLFLLVSAPEVKCGLIINEVMANEPQAQTSLEWIELFNDSLSSVSLADYRLIIGSDEISLPTGVVLGSNEYFIVCARLFSSGSTTGFEEAWGNNSGFWNDDPLESTLAAPFEVSMSLINGGGEVRLLQGTNLLSELSWTESGRDGYSWERSEPSGADIVQCEDRLGGSPGTVNSVTMLANDLAIDTVTVSCADALTTISVDIISRSFNEIDNGLVFLVDIGSGSNDTLAVLSLPAVSAGYGTTVVGEFQFAGMYVDLRVVLNGDERLRNNSFYFVACGQDFPPLILNEFLANPVGSLGSEWIEIKNIHGDWYDLSGWSIGDALGLKLITEGSIVVETNGHAVIVESTAGFVAHYDRFEGLPIEPDSWPILNNGGDIVRLVDPFGIEADRFAYDETFENNITWSRGVQPGRSTDWGRSAVAGGSPGEENNVFFAPDNSFLQLTVNPSHFTPDGDGIDETTSISIKATTADSYSLKLYDRRGRLLRTFFENLTMIPDRVEFDGRSDSGHRLQVGIYIVHLDGKGSGSIKRTLVIAR